MNWWVLDTKCSNAAPPAAYEKLWSGLTQTPQTDIWGNHASLPRCLCNPYNPPHTVLPWEEAPKWNPFSRCRQERCKHGGSESEGYLLNCPFYSPTLPLRFEVAVFKLLCVHTEWSLRVKGNSKLQTAVGIVHAWKNKGSRRDALIFTTNHSSGLHWLEKCVPMYLQKCTSVQRPWRPGERTDFVLYVEPARLQRK